MSAVIATASPRRRDWRIALGLSVVPGLGQLYNGQPAKALRLFAGTVALIGGSLALLLWGISAGPAVYNSLGLVFLLLALAIIVVFLTAFIAGLYVWGSAFIDAYASARSLSAGEDAARITFFHL